MKGRIILYIRINQLHQQARIKPDLQHTDKKNLQEMDQENEENLRRELWQIEQSQKTAVSHHEHSRRGRLWRTLELGVQEVLAGVLSLLSSTGVPCNGGALHFHPRTLWLWPYGRPCHICLSNHNIKCSLTPPCTVPISQMQILHYGFLHRWYEFQTNFVLSETEI